MRPFALWVAAADLCSSAPSTFFLMAESAHRLRTARWRLGFGVVLVGCGLLLAINVMSLKGVADASFERYYCDGGSPGPCICYRASEEPAGFPYNRISVGPPDGATGRIAIAVAAGLAVAVICGIFLVSQDDGTERPGPFGRVPPGLPSWLAVVGVVAGVVGVLYAGFMWLDKASFGPCDDRFGAPKVLIEPMT
jgi:hypothetical protein